MAEAEVERVQGALSQFNVIADDSGVDQQSYTWCYWRKPLRRADGTPAIDAGYIVYAPAWPTAYKASLRKGMQPLDTFYGEFHHPYDVRFKWRVPQDPFWLLFHKGGAKEFPLAQIIEHGWDRRPPYEDVVFPQLATVATPEDVICPYCFKKMPRLPNAEALLQQHVQVMHKEHQQSKQLADALSKANNLASEQVNGPLGELLSVISQGLQSQAASQAMLADRQRAQDERIEQLLGLLAHQIGAPATPAPAPAVPESVPEVEAGPIEFTAPEAVEEPAAVPEPAETKKRAR